MKKSLGLALVAGIILSSCNMPSSGAPDPQVATAAALTVQAAIASSSNTQQPLASPTSESGQEITETPTYSKPMISVGDVTNCRTGPSVNYERVTQILPNTSVEIIGFYSPNYWIVSTSAGNCWVSGEFATPTGSYTAVPTVTAPPTPQGGAPDIYFTEFASVDGLQSPGRSNVMQKLKFKESEKPLIAQIWGMKPENYYTSAKEIAEMGFDGIDINMGCPTPVVTRKGGCSAQRPAAGRIRSGGSPPRAARGAACAD